MAKIDDETRRFLNWILSRGDPKFGSTFNTRTIENAKNCFLIEPENRTWIVTEAGRNALSMT